MREGRVAPRTEGRTEASRPRSDPGLAELVDRLLDRGVVVKGELVVSVADVDLLYIGLDIVLSSVESLRRRIEDPGEELAEG